MSFERWWVLCIISWWIIYYWQKAVYIIIISWGILVFIVASVFGIILWGVPVLARAECGDYLPDYPFTRLGSYLFTGWIG